MNEVFHEGERAAQARAGVRERMAEVGPQVIRSAMPLQHREFFAQLPFIVLGTAGVKGPSATLLPGRPGFVHTPDDTTLRVDALPPLDDPAAEALRPGAAVGLLGIELPTRRRNRANGVVAALDAGGFTVHVQQSFGNCPQHIHPRAPSATGPADTGAVRQASHLDGDMAALAARADTLFIATHAAGGTDVSHRGGPAGFVRVSDDGRTLAWPDYDGNLYFNTVGNLMLDPHAGLVLPDFERGGLLHVAGRVELVWHGPEVEAVPRARRLLRLHVDEALLRPGALGQRWSLLA